MLIMAFFGTGVALALSAANVFFRDINYLWGIVAQLLFYATPIIYVAGTIDVGELSFIINWGPTGSFIQASHEIMYDQRMPGLGRWVYLLIVSVITFAAGAWTFQRLSPRFAEEL
jgi:ABC-type polysaccharide/polyol phosphate export permease